MKEVNYQGIEVNKKGIIKFWDKDINPITGKKEDRELHMLQKTDIEKRQTELRKENKKQIREIRSNSLTDYNFNFETQ